MKEIKSKTLEALVKSIQEIADTLTSHGYYEGNLKYGIFVINKDEYTEVSGPVEWIAKMWPSMKGGRFQIAEMVEHPNSDNYHFSGEELWMEVTVLNRPGRVPALLIELITIRLPEDDGSPFQNAKLEVIEKVYRIQI